MLIIVFTIFLLLIFFLVNVLTLTSKCLNSIFNFTFFFTRIYLLSILLTAYRSVLRLFDERDIGIVLALSFFVAQRFYSHLGRHAIWYSFAELRRSAHTLTAKVSLFFPIRF